MHLGYMLSQTKILMEAGRGRSCKAFLWGFILAGVVFLWFHESLAVAVVTRNPLTIVENESLLRQIHEVARRRDEQELALKTEVRLEKMRRWLIDRGFHAVVGGSAGNSTASPRRIFVLTDYQCVSCRYLDRQILFLLSSRPDIELVFFPMGVSGVASERAARAALLAARTGSAEFAVTHENLMSLPLSSLQDIVSSEDSSSSILVREAVQLLARLPHELGVRGLPALVYRGQVFMGSPGIAQLKELL